MLRLASIALAAYAALGCGCGVNPTTSECLPCAVPTDTNRGFSTAGWTIGGGLFGASPVMGTTGTLSTNGGWGVNGGLFGNGMGVSTPFVPTVTPTITTPYTSTLPTTTVTPPFVPPCTTTTVLLPPDPTPCVVPTVPTIPTIPTVPTTPCIAPPVNTYFAPPCTTPIIPPAPTPTVPPSTPCVTPSWNTGVVPPPFATGSIGLSAPQITLDRDDIRRIENIRLSNAIGRTVGGTAAGQSLLNEVNQIQSETNAQLSGLRDAKCSCGPVVTCTSGCNGRTF